MYLKAIVEENIYELQVPDALIEGARPFFEQLDRDMDGGWQMSRDWVSDPDRLQRCQIVANKLLTALEVGNDRIGRLMAGYILARLPGVESVELDIQGEIQNNLFHLAEPSGSLAAQAAPALGPSKLEAMEQAAQDVTRVFKVGKGYRFSVFDRAQSQWSDSPLFATEEEAARQRQAALKRLFESLQGPGGKT